MLIARVEGSVVATKKNDKMTGRRMVLVRPFVVSEPGAQSFKPASTTLVSYDALGA